MSQTVQALARERSGLQADQPADILRALKESIVRFRPFRGEADYASMAEIINGSKDVDGVEWATTADDVARNYRHLVNSDPDRDVTFVEVNGRPAGYSRVWWGEEQDGKRLYMHFAYLLPMWRRDGIRRSMMRRNERRLREIAAEHIEAGACPEPAGSQFFQAFAADTESHWDALLVDEGYEAVRHSFTMVRPSLSDATEEFLAAHPLPAGLEVRPVKPEHVPLIWNAAREAFRDHWGYSEDEWSLEHLRSWQESPTYDPALWQVAWDGNQVAGMVQNFVDTAENEAYERLRGYTEGICVRRPWRRRGLARALIARSFHLLREMGMEEAGLGVDAENLSGALQLYESMGFRRVKRHTTYRKPLA